MSLGRGLECGWRICKASEHCNPRAAFMPVSPWGIDFPSRSEVKLTCCCRKGVLVTPSRNVITRKPQFSTLPPSPTEGRCVEVNEKSRWEVLGLATDCLIGHNGVWVLIPTLGWVGEESHCIDQGTRMAWNSCFSFASQRTRDMSYLSSSAW